MDLQAIFSEISAQMNSDFSRTREALSHPGMKGNSLEEIVREFLRAYLPKSLDISTGILVDSNGNTSRQLDIIIFDWAKTPVFYARGDIRVIPVECAYAVIEVKATLSKDEVERCQENMRSVKALEKKAFFEPRGPIQFTQHLYGREWAHWPINYFIFAFESGSIDSVGQNIGMSQSGRPAHMRIDCVCILNRGVLFNIEPDGELSALPTPTSTFTGREMKSGLIFFYALLTRVLNQATMNPFNIVVYLKHIDFMAIE